MIDIHPEAFVCDLVQIDGTVTIGRGTVVHPTARISSLMGGKIVIGENNIIEETVEIINELKSDLVIGNKNHFRVGSRIVNCERIGHRNVFDLQSLVEVGAVVEDDAIVVVRGSCLPFSLTKSKHRVNVSGQSAPLFTNDGSSDANIEKVQEAELELLQKLLPLSNAMLKSENGKLVRPIDDDM